MVEVVCVTVGSSDAELHFHPAGVFSGTVVVSSRSRRGSGRPAGLGSRSDGWSHNSNVL